MLRSTFCKSKSFLCIKYTQGPLTILYDEVWKEIFSLSIFILVHKRKCLLCFYAITIPPHHLLIFFQVFIDKFLFLSRKLLFKRGRNDILDIANTSSILRIRNHMWDLPNTRNYFIHTLCLNF